MQTSLLQNPAQFIGPALIISVLGYLVHFFGKIIADQKPFADDRDWEIEFSGINFFINLIIFPGIFGLASAYYLGNFRIGSLLHFFLASVLGGWLLLTAALDSEKKYGIKIQWIRSTIFPWVDDKEFVDIKQKAGAISLYTPLSLFSLLFIYILALEYKASLIWLTIITTIIFFNFILLALNYSLRLFKPQKVDIFLIGLPEPLKDLTLLKINTDNIRLKDNDKIVILNKHQVLKIEIK